MSVNKPNITTLTILEKVSLGSVSTAGLFLSISYVGGGWASSRLYEYDGVNVASCRTAHVQHPTIVSL